MDDSRSNSVRVSKSGLQAWSESSKTVLKLESLLQCFICNRVMDDPHTLGACDHHFCRNCIIGALSGRRSNCPECGVPTWVRDIKTNRQLDNLVKLVSSMKKLLSNSTPKATKRDKATCLNKPGPSTVPSEPTTSMSSLGNVTSICSDESLLNVAVRDVHIASSVDQRFEEGVFKRPQANERMTRRRLNRARKPVAPNTYKLLAKSEHNTLNVSSIKNENDATCIINSSESTFFTSESRSVGTHGVVQDWNPNPPPRLRFPPTAPSPLLTAHRSLEKEPDVSTNLPAKKQFKLDPGKSLDQTRHCVAEQQRVSNQEFGKPSRRRKRRSIALEETTVNIPSTSVQFPFSPLVTKTRNYSKLDRTAKLHRLQQSGYGKETVEGRSELKVNKSQSGQQLTLHSFLSSVVKQDPQRKDENRVPVNSANPLPEGHTLPATPVSMHARTMRRNIRGETPLHIASIKGDVSAVRVLLQQGADPNVKDNAGWTPLHEACNHGHSGVTKVLLDHGALINIPGFDNDTPLHDAVANGRVEISKLLLERGANVTLRNRQGLTARELAISDAIKEMFTRYSEISGLHVSPNAIKSPCASPLLNGGPSKVVLLGTGLKGYHKKQMDEVATLLGAQVVDSFSTNVSHVVTVCNQSRCCSRTLKFLCGVATGKWIVSFQWITECLQTQNWVDETLYEVRGVIVGDSNLVSEAPRKGRENVSQKTPGLFDGCEFYLMGIFPPTQASKEDLSRLIKLAGGKVLTREPKDHSLSTVCPYHMNHSSKVKPSSTFVVYDPCCTEQNVKSKNSSTQTTHVAIVPASWLLDCLSCFELIAV